MFPGTVHEPGVAAWSGPGQPSRDPPEFGDDDGEGLVDEDDRSVTPLPATWVRTVYAYQLPPGMDASQTRQLRFGSVTFVQRFGSAVNVNPHYHVLMPDGVYVTGKDGTPTFVHAPRRSDDDVQQIVETTAKRVVRLLHRPDGGW